MTPSVTAACGCVLATTFLTKPVGAGIIVDTFSSVADTVIVAPGGGTAAGDTNFGSRILLDVGWQNGGGVNRSLLRFDLSSLAGQYDAIKSISLRLTVHTSQGTAPRETQIYEISAANADWVEGASNGPAQIGESTWNKKINNATNWSGSPGLSTPGVDYVNTLLASQVFETRPDPGDVIDFVFASADLTALIDQWVNVMPGLLLLDPLPYGGPSGSDRILYASRDSTTYAAPELLIAYFVPEPASLSVVLTGVLVLRGTRRRSCA